MLLTDSTPMSREFFINMSKRNYQSQHICLERLLVENDNFLDLDQVRRIMRHLMRHILTSHKVLSVTIQVLRSDTLRLCTVTLYKTDMIPLYKSFRIWRAKSDGFTQVLMKHLIVISRSIMES